MWIQDGDPSRNCAAARTAFKDINASLMFPPRSPDMNPIETLFHLVRKKLNKQAISNRITKETYEQFSERVVRTINGMP